LDTALISKNKRPPATKEDKMLLKQAIDLLNECYSETDAQEDEAIRDYRQEKLNWLLSLNEKKLNTVEKKQLQEFIVELRGEANVNPSSDNIIKMFNQPVQRTIAEHQQDYNLPASSHAAIKVYADLHLEQGSSFSAGDVTVRQSIYPPHPPKDKLPSVWGLPSENVQFYERQLTTKIAEKMTNREGKQRNQLVLVAMSGLGGVGKTELAKHYVYHAKKNYTSRLWFNANTRERLEAEYRALAQELNFHIDEKTSNENIKKKLHTFLAEHPGWLMVVDNADDMEQIQPLLPPQGGDILITSRQSHWKGEVITIDVLEEGEAIAFYKKLSNREDDEESIKALVKELGYLPLAIAQAAAYVEHSGSISAKEYLSLFNDCRVDLLANNDLPASDEEEGARLTITTTWSLSLKAIERKYNSTDEARGYARTLLTACAYLDSLNIPRIVLEKYFDKIYPGKSSKLLLNKAISDLTSYSLIQAEKDFVHIHKLVQEVVMLQIAENELLLLALASVLSEVFVINNYSIEEISNIFSLLSHCEAFTKHIQENKNNLQFLSKLKLNMANAYSVLTDHAKAVVVLEENLEFQGIKINFSVMQISYPNYSIANQRLLPKLIAKLSDTYLSLYKQDKNVNDIKGSLVSLKMALKLNTEIYGKNNSQVTLNKCQLILILNEMSPSIYSKEFVLFFDYHFPEYRIGSYIENKLLSLLPDSYTLSEVRLRIGREVFNNKASHFMTGKISENKNELKSNVIGLIDAAINQIKPEDNNYEVFIVLKTLANIYPNHEKVILLRHALRFGIIIYGENSLISAETKVELAKCTQQKDESIRYYLQALKITNELLQKRKHPLVKTILSGLQDKIRKSSPQNYLDWNYLDEIYISAENILFEKLSVQDADTCIISCLVLLRINEEELRKKLNEDFILKEKILDQLKLVSKKTPTQELAEFLIRITKCDERIINIFVTNLNLDAYNQKLRQRAANELIKLKKETQQVAKTLIDLLSSLEDDICSFAIESLIKLGQDSEEEMQQIIVLLVEKLTVSNPAVQQKINKILIKKGVQRDKHVMRALIARALEVMDNKILEQAIIYLTPFKLEKEYKEMFENLTDKLYGIDLNSKEYGNIAKKIKELCINNAELRNMLIERLNAMISVPNQTVTEILIEINKEYLHDERIVNALAINLFSKDSALQSRAYQQLSSHNLPVDLIDKNWKTVEIVYKKFCENKTFEEIFDILVNCKILHVRKIIIGLTINLKKVDENYFMKVFEIILNPNTFSVNTDPRACSLLDLLNELSKNDKTSIVLKPSIQWSSPEGQYYAAIWLAKRGVYSDRIGMILVASLANENKVIQDDAANALLLVEKPSRSLIRKLLISSASCSDSTFVETRKHHYLTLSHQILIKWSEKDRNVIQLLMNFLNNDGSKQKIEFRLALTKLLARFLKEKKDLVSILIENFSTQKTSGYQSLVAKLQQLEQLSQPDLNSLIEDLAHSESSICYISVTEKYNSIVSSQLKDLAVTPSLMLPLKAIERTALNDNQVRKKLLLETASLGDYVLADALSKGDCFFDACAQALILMGKTQVDGNSYDVKSLRCVCYEYALQLDGKMNRGEVSKKENWIHQELKSDEQYHNYLATIRFTAEEAEEEKNHWATKGLATWGQLSVDGRIICEQLGISIHWIEILEKDEATHAGIQVLHQLQRSHSKTSSLEHQFELNYQDESLIHLVVYKSHVVPLLKFSDFFHQQLDTNVSQSKPLSLSNTNMAYTYKLLRSMTKDSLVTEKPTSDSSRSKRRASMS